MSDMEDEDDFDECDCCGEPSEGLDWLGGYLLCPKCLDAEEDRDADRGDWECHQERDQ